MWDVDEIEARPIPSLGRRTRRAAAVAAVWGLAVLPVVAGWQRCAFAAFLHRPCPGCGMTRALQLLAGGHVEASLRMHPLAVPVLAMGAFFMASTVWATFTVGSPLTIYKGRFGRATLLAMAVVYGGAFVLWILRWLGLFGGPVPVY